MSDASYSPDAVGSNAEDHKAEDLHVCSGKGCVQPAVWEIVWNNPKVHTPDRRKIWLACEDHRISLSDFLAARSFLKDVVPHLQD